MNRETMAQYSHIAQTVIHRGGTAPAPKPPIVGDVAHLPVTMKLRPSAARVLWVLQENAKDNISCVPGTKIARAIGTSPGAVFVVIGHLVEQGFVEKLGRRAHGEGSAYRILRKLCDHPDKVQGKMFRTLACPVDPNAPITEAAAPTWKGGDRAVSKDQTLSRFGSKPPRPEVARDLRADHPALVQERTIFPSTVVSAWDSDRIFVSGHNNPKLGAEIAKGRWAGMPVYHLTLEERASCPRSCALWAGCYGNAMHMAKRHDHTHPRFLTLLEAELWMLAREHKKGFVVRLHTLGDFFSVEYVEFWRSALEWIDQLHAFGYSANHPEAENESEAAIGQAIARLSDDHWDRFAIRFSGGRGAQRTFVTNEAVEAPDVIMCPAQTQATMACSTCGICWSSAAREKAVGFLKHGMIGRAGAGDAA